MHKFFARILFFIPAIGHNVVVGGHAVVGGCVLVAMSLVTLSFVTV